MRMITIRLSDEEHRAIAYQAASVNKSINSYILNTLGIPVAPVGKLRGRKSKVLKQCKCGNPYDECICDQCKLCNDTGEIITGKDNKEYPGDSGVEPKGGGSLHECICQDSSSSHLDTDTTDTQVSQ